MTANRRENTLDVAGESAPARHRSRLHRVVGRAAMATGERGQTLVEFALVLPLLLLVIFGITQFGLALNSVNDETHLANEAARYASVNYNPGGAQSLLAWVKSQADTTIGSSGGQICISFPNGTSNPGDPVQVSVTENFNWQPLYGISQLVGGGIPASTSISGKAVMRLEASPSAYSAGCV